MEHGIAMEQAGTSPHVEAKKKLVLWLALLVLAMAAIVVLISGGGAPSRKVSIALIAQASSGLQVFYDVGSGFSESESARFELTAGPNQLTVPLPNAPLKALRIDVDPAASPVSLQLQKIAIDTPRKGESVEIVLSDATPANEIVSIDRTPSGLAVRTVEGARDANIVFVVTDNLRSTGVADHLAVVCQLLLLLATGGWVVLRLARMPMGIPVPALLLGAWLLAAALAFTSSTSVPTHPDELNHVTAARYYLTHWIPPAVDSPKILDSYTIWGTTYLSELDTVYLFAAKASLFWPGSGLNETTALRLFNILLLGILLAVAWIRRSTWDATAILLLTPQIWYVFSYFNADAFPLFLSLIVAMLFAAPDSPVSRFVEGHRASRIALFLFVLALGLLLVSKRNYPPVVFVVGLILAARHLGLDRRGIVLAATGASLLLFRLVAGDQLVYIFPNAARWFAPVGLVALGLFGIRALRPILREPAMRLQLYRLVLLFGLAITVALPRVVADVAANGGPAEKSQRMIAAAERHAGPLFKPSIVENNLAESYPGIRLAARGVPFSHIICQPYAWALNSWRSMLGVYGYMNVFTPNVFYWMLSGGLLMLAISMVAWARKRPDAQMALMVAVAGIALVALSSIVHSWANAFQAQGRYLFPGLVIVGIYLLSQPGLLRTRLASFGVSLCFVVSVLSFASALPTLAGN